MRPAVSSSPLPLLAGLLVLRAGGAHGACSADDGRCSVGLGASSRGLAREARAAASVDQVLLQRGISEHKFSSRQRREVEVEACTPENQNPLLHGHVRCCSGLHLRSAGLRFLCVGASSGAGACTPKGDDPWSSGSEVECCEGSRANLERWPDGSLHYFCRASAATAGCTPLDADPFSTGEKVECCEGLQANLEPWSDGTSHYRCRASLTVCMPEGVDPFSTGEKIDCCEGLQASLERGSDGDLHYLCREARASAMTIGCTPLDADPFSTGEKVECCEGLQANLEPWSDGTSHYRCRASLIACTPEGVDMFSTGEKIDCCEGLHADLVQASHGDAHFLCRLPAVGASTTPAASAGTGTTPAGGEGLVAVNLLTWNVHWKNEDTQGMANVITPSGADIVGLCELAVSPSDMAAALSSATGRDFAVQPGRGGWQGYGTDIFFDTGKWEGLEGGVQKVRCPGTRGGDRAANWAVLRDRAHGKVLITGGIHLSFCDGGCDATHECELGMLYDNFERMRSKYPGAAVAWMGGLYRDMSTAVMGNLMRGQIAARSTFALDDLAQTRENTHYMGGTPVDHILGEDGKFVRISGGRTGQGVTGQLLSGAHYFPVTALVHYGL